MSCAVRFALADDVEIIDDFAEDVGNKLPASTLYGHFQIDVTESGEPVELGRGGMGTTYRGWDSVLHTSVALKVININVANHPEARARFIREARAAAQLRHPNIASVFHYGEQDGKCFYAMELVEGETLEARILREGPLSVYLALEIVAQVARALAAAETRGIVHRDLKPSNLMLVKRADTEGTEESPIVKVIDFGLAKMVSEIHEDRGAADARIVFVGTPAFASPEQYSKLADASIDTRSDIYSLGVTLWYLLCGRTPFVGKSLYELEEKQRNSPMPIHQLKRAHVPRRVVGLLKTLLAVDPGSRPQSARELLGLLAKCQDKFPLLASERKRRRRNQLLVYGLSLAIAAAAVIGFYQAKPPVIPPDRSIAVLPFKSPTSEKADSFFTTAIQYGITAKLAEIPSFKVVGPENTAEYTSKSPDYRIIGGKLGVRYLLEGSVQRDGDQVHVAIRLDDLNNLARPLTSQYTVPISEALAFQSEQRQSPQIVQDPSSLLAFLLPLHAGSLGSLATGVGASVPFTEYEAESGALSGGALTVSLTSPLSHDRDSPQLEASGRAFVQLAGRDQSVSWTNNTDKSITAINLRYSIPDSPTGGGLNETLDLYVNGTFRQVLHLTSAQTWVYQTRLAQHGTAQSPGPGLYPYVFFDEMHTWIQGDPVAPGSTIMLKQDASNTAAFYWIDLVDLETPPNALPKPADFLSIEEFGARPNDASFDNTLAFKSCIAAAGKQHKGVWVPVGEFYLAPKDPILAGNITIEGAGPWYSIIYRTSPRDTSGRADIFQCTSCTIRNLAFDSDAKSSNPAEGYCSAFYVLGPNWLLDNIWAQHISLVHAVSLSGTVENCRVNNAWGRGIVVNNGVPDTQKTDAIISIQNNFCRGNFGNGIALQEWNKFPFMHRPKITNNTSVCSCPGVNLFIGGGSDITVENNLLRDSVNDANMIVGMLSDDLNSVVVRDNVLIRGGGEEPPFEPIASLIIGGTRHDPHFSTTVSNIDVENNIISDSLFSAVLLGWSLNTVLQNNVISSPGTVGIDVVGDGPGVLIGNQIKGLAPGQSPIRALPGGRSLTLPTAAASYNDASPGVVSENCSEGGRDVSGFKDKSYLHFRGLELTDVTDFQARVAASANGGNIEVRLDNPNGPLIGSTAVPDTGGWMEWKTLSFPTRPAQGFHDVYLVCTGEGEKLFHLEWFNFSTEVAVTAASNYSSASGDVRTEPSGERESNLGHICDGFYTSYDNIDWGGKKTFYARVCTPGPGGKIDLRLDSPTGAQVGSCVVPLTGGWGKWKTVSCPLEKSSGIHSLFLLYSGQNANPTGSIFDVEWFGFDLPSVGYTPAVRENDASPGIKIQPCVDGGQYLGNFYSGDFVAYKNINMTGLALFSATMASNAHMAGELEIRLDSPTGPLVGSCHVSLTGNWQNWGTQSCELTPSEGFHNLYLVYNCPESGDFANFRSFRLSPPSLSDSP